MVKRKAAPLRLTERQKLNLTDPLIGGEDPVFPSDAARREAWEANRHALLGDCRPGHRPGAWWDYDAPEHRDYTRPEVEQLLDLGLLRPEELADLGINPNPHPLGK